MDRTQRILEIVEEKGVLRPRDLAAHGDAEHTFAFLNRADAVDAVASLFVERKVVVFTGGDEFSRPKREDGLDVYVLGGQFSDVAATVDPYGAGPHYYMLVTVSGDAVIPAVVRVGTMEAPDEPQPPAVALGIGFR